MAGHIRSAPHSLKKLRHCSYPVANIYTPPPLPRPPAPSQDRSRLEVLTVDFPFNSSLEARTPPVPLKPPSRAFYGPTAVPLPYSYGRCRRRSSSWRATSRTRRRRSRGWTRRKRRRGGRGSRRRTRSGRGPRGGGNRSGIPGCGAPWVARRFLPLLRPLPLHPGRGRGRRILLLSLILVILLLEELVVNLLVVIVFLFEETALQVHGVRGLLDGKGRHIPDRTNTGPYERLDGVGRALVRD